MIRASSADGSSAGSALRDPCPRLDFTVCGTPCHAEGAIECGGTIRNPATYRAYPGHCDNS